MYRAVLRFLWRTPPSVCAGELFRNFEGSCFKRLLLGCLYCKVVRYGFRELEGSRTVRGLHVSGSDY